MTAVVNALRRTPLFEVHRDLGAKFTPFGGWEMPVYYSGIIPEHMAVRNACGIFDVSHMCPISVEGPDALKVLQYICSNNVEKLGFRRVQYNLLCNERGGVVDDILLYRLGESKFIVVANASNAEKVKEWMERYRAPQMEITDLQPPHGIVSLQGPRCMDILRHMNWEGLQGLRKNDIHTVDFKGREMLVSRTGYTGSDGYEFLVPNEVAIDLWAALSKSGDGAIPSGLGARDSLRTEAGLPLYGHEYSDDLSPIGTPFSWAIKLDKGNFVGRDALRKEKEVGPKYTLVGFTSDSRSIPRAGQKVFRGEDLSGVGMGWVSSGTFSPVLSQAIGFAFLEGGGCPQETPIFIDVRGRAVRAIISTPPFVGKRL